MRHGSPTLWGEPGQSFLATLQADLCLLGAHAITGEIVTESSIERRRHQARADACRPADDSAS